MKRARDGTEHALRFKLVIIPMEGEQVMQVQRRLRPLNESSIRPARRQVRVAIGSVGRGLVKENVDERSCRSGARSVGAPETDAGPAHGATHWTLQKLLKGSGHGGN